jgi:ribosomal protein S18 acetylase RimI-like enzyme
MSEEVVLRPATAEDAAAAAAVAREVFAGVSVDYFIEQNFGEINGTTWEDRKGEEVKAEILGCPEAGIVAERGGEIIGFVTTSYDANTKIGRIVNLAVATQAQGRGIGKLLMQAARDLLVSKGATHLQIESLETNSRGMGFYTKLGFKEIVRKVYYFMEVGQWQCAD